MELFTALDDLTHEGSLVKAEGDGVRCLACAHRCLIKDGKRGICKVRYNHSGILRVPWGYVAGLNPDPIEKKPFSHFLPGSLALTFGMLGCNFHCDFCQNWLSSQVGRDTNSDDSVRYIQKISPEEIVALAKTSGCAGNCIFV